MGNALEVKEAIATLKGEYSGDLLELCLVLGSCILTGSGMCVTMEEAREKLLGTIRDGSALKKLEEFIAAQEGDPNVVRDLSLLAEAPVQRAVVAEADGYVGSLDALGIGMVSLKLGGGRATKEDSIDPAVGVVLRKKVGESVKVGEALAVVHAASEADADMGEALLRECIAVTAEAPEQLPFVREIVT